MEQRPLRLGDIVDDYCPRERRITNHVIVALVEDGIRQTRCGTCDTEHVYKAARLPRRRLKGDDESDAAPGQLVSRPAAEVPTSEPPVVAVAPPPAAPALASPAATNGAGAPAPAADVGQPPGEHADDVWPAHRRLIRATLPRVEGEQKEPRPIPEFTMHQRQGRGGNPYRGDHFANGNGNNRGNGAGGFRPGQPGPRREPGPGQPGAGAAGGGGKRWRRRRGRGGPKAN